MLNGNSKSVNRPDTNSVVFQSKWAAIAARNTQIYRKVFKCLPDDTVTTWSDYKAFLAWADRLSRSQISPGEMATAPKTQLDENVDKNNQRFPGDPAGLTLKHSRLKDEKAGDGSGVGSTKQPDNSSESAGVSTSHTEQKQPSGGADGEGAGGDAAPLPPSSGREGTQGSSNNQAPAPQGFSDEEMKQMEELLDETQGNLVVFSTRWLEKESASGNLVRAFSTRYSLSVPPC